MYKIGVYKSGQHFAKEVFASKKLKEVEYEFKRMWEETDFCPYGTDNEAENADVAWKWKRFSEDTKNVAVFRCGPNDTPITNFAPQGLVSNMMKQ